MHTQAFAHPPRCLTLTEPSVFSELLGLARRDLTLAPLALEPAARAVLGVLLCRQPIGMRDARQLACLEQLALELLRARPRCRSLLRLGVQPRTHLSEGEG